MLRRALILFLLAGALSACGGGGGGSGDNTGGSPPPPTATISVSNTSLNFLSTTGNFFTPQTLVVTYDGDEITVGTPSGAALPGWLYIAPPQGLTSPVTFSVVVFPISPGRFTTTVRFMTRKAGGPYAFRDVNITLTVDHTLTPAIARLTAPLGTAASNLTASFSITTLGATWAATSNQSWLTIGQTSGTGSATLNVTAATAALPEGIHTATIAVRDTLTNRTRTATVELSIIRRRLDVLPRGVALTSTQGTPTTSRTVRVFDTLGLSGRWTISDDAPWLQLSSPSGTGDGTVTLTANDAGLADGMHYATVTVAPDQEPEVTNTATVRVGFYVDRTSPAPPEEIIIQSPDGATPLVTDPIRPYAYSVSVKYSYPGGVAAVESTLAVYNVYTGELVEALLFPEKRFWGLSISQDGGLLIGSASASNGTVDTLIPIALTDSTRTVGASWPITAGPGAQGINKIVEIGGTRVIVTGSRQILSATNGAVLATFTPSGLPSSRPDMMGWIAVAPDGSAVHLLGMTNGNHDVARFSLFQAGGSFRALETHAFLEPGTSSDIGINPEGTRVVTVSEDYRVYDSRTMTLLGTYPRNQYPLGESIDTAINGDMYVTQRDGALLQYDRNFGLKGRRIFPTGSRSYAGGQVSGDGQRAIVVEIYSNGTGYSILHFFSAQLPP